MTAPVPRSPGFAAGSTVQLWGLVLSLALLASGLSVAAEQLNPSLAAEDPLGLLAVGHTALPAPAVAATVAEAAPVARPPVEAASTPAAEPAPEPPAAPVLPPGEVERISLVGAEPRLAAFRGLSTWVDLYDIEISPEEQVARASAGGVQTIFVQTARFNSPGDIHDAGLLGRLIEAAHDRGMQVMTWYIPDHLDHGKDLRRAQAAMTFTTPRGDQPDAFGLDIEMESLSDVAERSRRLLQLSAELRQWAGPDFPMAAIVLPPLQLDLRSGWWPAFPWAELRSHYDVFIPMSYSSYRGTDPGTTYAWNFHNIVETRLRSGDPNLPIHMAGGIADRLPHVDAFVDALRDGHVLGGGLYDLHTTQPNAWPRLRALRAE